MALYLIIGFFCLSLYAVIVEQNIFKKLIFSSIMQSSVIVYYVLNVWNVSLLTPFYTNDNNASSYVDPVPQVLMLTAIVVGFATTALGLAIVVRIKKMSKSIIYNEIDGVDKN